MKAFLLKQKKYSPSLEHLETSLLVILSIIFIFGACLQKANFIHGALFPLLTILTLSAYLTQIAERVYFTETRKLKTQELLAIIFEMILLFAAPLLPPTTSLWLILSIVFSVVIVQSVSLSLMVKTKAMQAAFLYFVQTTFVFTLRETSSLLKFLARGFYSLGFTRAYTFFLELGRSLAWPNEQAVPLS